uniref:Uncharacterized protein n=1 Tax=Panagrolaimus sp. PS1159 TaxID=55785 RepID=A0AC35EYI6_9BILA
MKLCFKILFCFFLVLSLGFLDALNDSLILDGNILDEVHGLLSSDGFVTAKQKDKDVELSGTGQINLTLDNGELELKVCKDRCIAKSTVCYESENGLSDPEAAGTCFESSCKVEIEGKTDKITFGRALFLKKRFTGCITSVMNHEFANVISSYISYDIESCKPKIVGADKMVKLFVNIEDGCSVIVVNAKIHVPSTPTPLPLTVPAPTQSSQKGSEASSFPDWGYAIIGIVILIVILFIGCVV